MREFIQTQSTRLASDALSDVRERTVNADRFMHNLLRRLLRRAPAQILETPAPTQPEE